jgi:hypothetical protein
MTLHVATSHKFGGAVARAIHRPVCFVTENLLLGPCAVDPEEHARIRADYWDLRGRELTRFRASFRGLRAAIASRERVVIWTTRCLADTAALWWLCAWRLHQWPLQPDLDVVTLGPDPGPVTGLDRINVRVRGADVHRGLDEMRPLSLTRVRSLARAWRKLASRVPPSVPETGRVDQDHADLLDLATYGAGFFPRLESGRLALSRFDALFFSCLGDDWLTPLEVYVQASTAGEELTRLMAHTGDVLLGTRMAKWAEHGGPHAALESKPERPERGPLLAARYRVSRVGEAIRREGLREVAQAPSLAVFGATAYDPGAPWVVVEEQGGGPIFRLRT